MSVTVEAKRDLEGYILDTTITVNIPKGTIGTLINQVRNDIVIVQFDVASLPALRVNRTDLLMNDTLEAIIKDAERIIAIEPFIEADVHRALDNALVRALELLTTDENRAEINQLISVFKSVPKHYQANKK